MYLLCGGKGTRKTTNMKKANSFLSIMGPICLMSQRVGYGRSGTYNTDDQTATLLPVANVEESTIEII
jgi:hypothetical protein